VNIFNNIDTIKAQNSSFDAEFKFLGKELDAETGYTKTDNRYYWAEAGVFLSVDPLSEKYPMLSSYNYAGNNPLIFKDPSGLDFDPTIDHKKKTITINATYYTSKENESKLQAGLDIWNEKSGEYSYRLENGDEYFVNFNLTIDAKYDNIDKAENAFLKDKSNSANIFKTADNLIDPYSDEELRGYATNNQIFVDILAASRTVAHEIGHTLGVGEFSRGLMQSGGKENNISSNNIANILNRSGFNTIKRLEAPHQVGAGYGKPKSTYNMWGFLRTKK
jgi:RHS repeat-associated protein